MSKSGILRALSTRFVIAVKTRLMLPYRDRSVSFAAAVVADERNRVQGGFPNTTSKCALNLSGPAVDKLPRTKPRSPAPVSVELKLNKTWSFSTPGNFRILGG